LNNKIITIIGIVVIFGVFIFASFNENNNAIEQEIKQKAEIQKAEAKKLKQKIEIEKAEAEKLRHKAEIEKAEAEKLRHKAEIEKVKKRKLQQQVKRKRLQESNEKCKDNLSLLEGRFNSAASNIWDDDSELQAIQQDAIKYKYKCQSNKQDFQNLIDKCKKQLK